MLLSMICGKIADKFGRIWLFRRIPLIKIASGIGLACSQNIIMFIAFLIFLGFGAGADMTIAGTTFKEYIP